MVDAHDLLALAADLPWAAVAPISGTVAGGDSASVGVLFDSGGLTFGVYTGTLCVSSNDPDEALLTVPLTLTVAPVGCQESCLRSAEIWM